MQTNKKYEVQNQLRALFNYLEYSGLHYFSANELDKNSSFKKKPSFLRFLYMFTRLSFMIYLFVIHIFTNNNEPGLNNLLLKILHIADIVASNLLIIIGLLETYLATSKIKIFYWNLNKIYLLLHNEFSIKIDYMDMSKRNFVRLAIICFGLFGLVIFSAVAKGTNLLAVIISCIVIFFFVCIFHYTIFLIDIVNHLLEYLNESLKTMLEIENDSKVATIYKFPKIQVTGNYRTQLQKIKSARRIYNLISHSANLVNKSLGFTMLLVILCVVISETLDGFRIFISYIEKNQTHLMSCEFNFS